jgi:hypothetical protein
VHTWENLVQIWIAYIHNDQSKEFDDVKNQESDLVDVKNQQVDLDVEMKVNDYT